MNEIKKLLIAIIIIVALSFLIALHTYAEPTQNSNNIDKDKYEKLPLTEKIKIKIIGTMKATGLMWLPILSCILIGLLILGNTFDSMSRFNLLSYKLLFMAVLGFIFIYFSEQIAEYIIKIAEKTDPTI